MAVQALRVYWDNVNTGCQAIPVSKTEMRHSDRPEQEQPGLFIRSAQKCCNSALMVRFFRRSRTLEGGRNLRWPVLHDGERFSSIEVLPFGQQHFHIKEGSAGTNKLNLSVVKP
jgi:hypothetical protein